MKKTCVLLINLGTPDSPKTSDVRKYLREFLNDPRVIDINPVGRYFLVNGIIAPFRAPKSAKVYQQLWTMWGGKSPLLTYGEKLRDLVQEKLSHENVTVEFAMRYQNPSLDLVLKRIQKAHYDRIVIFPLFPHHASSTSGSAIEKAVKIISAWWVVPEIKIVAEYFNHPAYIHAFVDRAKQYNVKDYDHVLFSYHGLPERHIEKSHPGLTCAACNCDRVFNQDQPLCYRNECYETSRLIAEKLGLLNNQFTVAFQSRLGKTPWLKPYADQEVEKMAKSGVKKLLVLSPAFIADCLETSIEIGVEYQHVFTQHGGEKVQLVESLNDSPLWVNAVCELVACN